MTPFEFRKDCWRQNTRLPVLSCGVVCVVLRLAVLVELRLVTDTDTQTRGQVIYRTEHSSRGKNLTIFPCGLSYDINENEELNWERQEAK